MKKSVFKTSSIVFMGIVSVLAGKVARASGAAICGFNVTSIVADTDSNKLPLQFQSDGLGPYKTYTKSRTDSATSQIQGNSCDWVLDLSNSQSRTVKLTLAYPASSNNPPPPFQGPTNVAAYIISKCGKNPLNNGLSYGTMTYVGQTLQCGLSVDLGNFSGYSYEVRMNPNNYAGTTWVEVTCTGAANSQCNTWTITPIASPSVINPQTGQNSALGELIQTTIVHGHPVDTPVGLYYIALSVLITNP